MDAKSCHECSSSHTMIAAAPFGGWLMALRAEGPGPGIPIYNVSVVDEAYRLINAPTIIDLPDL